ncbi:hypothetical protein ACFPM3_18340 [Streptomyces coeruleoprunus]|uniref:Uncharacterized protein n=1 Tax=Streptomyces coeruleoprunus TaxID=285563 RepID=A0ABV9XJ17_9ACTN
MSGDERFEEELAVALRRTGDGFGPGDGSGLVTGGVARGRRRVVRRRVGAVTGGALALALVGVGGAYTAGALGGGGGGDRDHGGASVAAPPKPTGQAGPARQAVSGERLLALFKGMLPKPGELTDTTARGTEEGPMVSGVFDDGRGKAAVGIAFFHAGPDAAGFTRCPDRALNAYDACTMEQLPGGASLMIYQGYEYPDKREGTKNWRATLLDDSGVVVDLNTWNAPAQKGAPVSRPNPPFNPAQMRAIVTAKAWKAVVAAIPDPADLKGAPGASGTDTGEGRDKSRAGAPAREKAYKFNTAGVRPLFMSLLPKGLTVTDKGGDGEWAYAVVDDGRGGSFVQVNAQPDMSDVETELFPEGSYTTLPDGTKVRARQQPGEKGGKDVVWWSVDTMRPDGYRVVVSAFNTPAQHQDASRPEPALSMEQLTAIATSEKWLKLKK